MEIRHINGPENLSGKETRVVKKPAHEVALDILEEIIHYEVDSNSPYLVTDHPGMVGICERILSTSSIPTDELPHLLNRLENLRNHIDDHPRSKFFIVLNSLNNITTSQTPTTQD